MTKSAIAPSSGRSRGSDEPEGAGGSDRPSGVDLHERARGRRLHEPEPEQRQRRADHERDEREGAGSLAGDDAEHVDRLQDQPLQERGHDRERDQEHADPEEEARAAGRTSGPRPR